MSDLAATNCGCNDCGCGGWGTSLFGGGNSCSCILWIICLLCCGGNNGCGNNNGCCNDSCWIIILLLLCCGNNGCGCNNCC